MRDTMDFKIDYEKLRKKLIRREFLKTFFVQTGHNTLGLASAFDATPEELLQLARTYNINLDKFRIK